jgi:WD40 repeat protein
VRFSPDGKKFASTGSDQRALRIYDAQKHLLLWDYTKFKDQVTSCQFFGEGKYLIAASLDKTVRSFDVQTGQEIKVVELSFKPITSVSINKVGSLVAIGCNDGQVSLLNWPSGGVKKTFSGKHNSAIRELTFNNQGTYLATAGDSKKIVIFDVVSEIVYERSLNNTEKVYHESEIYSLAFSFDDKYLASGDTSGKIKIFDVIKDESTEFNPGEKLSGVVYDLKFSKNSKLLVCCSSDYTIKLWDIAGLAGKGELLKTIEKEFEEGVISIDFNHDDSRVVACSSSHLKLFDLKAKEPLVSYYNKGFKMDAKKSLFSYDGSKLISLSQNENIVKRIDSKTGDDISVIPAGNMKAADGKDLVENENTIARYFIDISVNPANSDDIFAVSYHSNSVKLPGIISFKGMDKYWDVELSDKVINK